MFERDKDDLRELGLVIETVENLDGEVGYLARRDSNRLPPIALDAEEAAALGLAAKVWQQARLAGAASGALQKLRAAGAAAEDVDPYEAHSALEPRIPAHEAAFEPLMLACRDRRPVVFDYRKANAARPEPPPGRALGAGVLARPLVPGRLGPRPRRRAGLPALPDHRQGPLARPARFTAAGARRTSTVRETVASWAGESADRTARIRLRTGAGYPLRAKALPPVRELGDGWDELEIPYGHGLDAWLVEFGPGRGGAGARRAAGRRGGPAARRGQGLRGSGDCSMASERHRPDPADAVPGDLSAGAARRPRRAMSPAPSASPRTS